MRGCGAGAGGGGARGASDWGGPYPPLQPEAYLPMGLLGALWLRRPAARVEAQHPPPAVHNGGSMVHGG
eukprot:9469574-Pyramimonas_sp.AAC.1